MKSVTCVGNKNCTLGCRGNRIRLLKYGYNNSECTETFSKEHAYHLYQECSGLKRCNAEARSGNVTCDTMGTTVSADRNSIKYQCINEHDTVQFCKRKTIEKEVVNIYFNNDVKKKFKNQMCKCTLDSNDYSVTMEDIRPLRRNDTSHCSSAIIKHFDEKCDDSKEVWENFVYRKLWNTTTSVITVKHIFAQGKDDRPTMIWIRVERKGNGNVQVKCEDAVRGETTPTVGSPSTTKPSSGSARVTADSNKVPVAAIVVPLLLVLLGSTVAVMSVWFWRKRRKAATGKNTNISNGQHNVTYVSSGVSSVVSSGVSSGRISGTDRTYDLPEEDEYSTIDGNGLAKSSCESDNDGYAVPADAVRADDTTEYNVANLQSKHVLLDPSSDRIQGTSTNKVLSTQADDYSHVPLTTRSAQLSNLDRPNDGSYSHLQGPPTATEYSHIIDSDATCSRPTGWMVANGADEFSHLQVTKPPTWSLDKLPDDEEDTYDHTSSGRAIHHAEQIPVSVVTGLSPLFSHTAASSSGKQEVPVDDDAGEEHAYFTLEKVDQQ